MRFLSMALAVFVSVLMLGPWRAFAQKSEAGLIAAWEREQKSDPKTTKFEKLSDKKYRFATTRFPYDGELRITDVNIQDDFYSGDDEFSFARGTIGVELTGLPEDFERKHAASYFEWNSKNNLYWDAKSQRWLTNAEYFQTMSGRGRARTNSFRTFFWSFGLSGLLAVILLGFLWALAVSLRRAKVMAKRSERGLQIAERNQQLAELNVQIQQENAKTFKEILELLKQRSS